ncbi:MAG: MFS transporter [Anaerolineae bacterium]|nr:MFS transporter [Anaerolineae bacterium]
MTSSPDTLNINPTRLPIQTLAYFIAFIVLGLAGALVGPAISTLASNTGVSLSDVSIIFVFGALGRMLGSAIAGGLIGRMRGHIVIVIGFIGMMVLLSLVPLVSSLWLLIVVLFLFGIAECLVDVSTNTLIVWVHGAKVGPYMNGLHLMFGVGSIFSPLLVAQSLQHTAGVNWAFWLAALCILPMLLWVARVPSPAQMGAAGHAADATDSHSPADKIPLSFWVAAGVFAFLAVGAELLMIGWTFSFGVQMGLDPTSSAGTLASSFWLLFTFGRLLSIPLALRVKPFTLLVGGILIVALGSGLMLINAPSMFVWLGVALVGLGVAPLYPTMLTFLGGQVKNVAALTSFLFIVANFGAMVLPWAVGQGFEVAGRWLLPTVQLACQALALLALFVLARQKAQ